jgi:hypothetical protein
VLFQRYLDCFFVNYGLSLSVCSGMEISLGILVVGCGGEGCRHDSDCFIGPFPLGRFVAD